jgi:hypothetical protein
MRTHHKKSPGKGQHRRWVLFTNGCVHGVEHSELTIFRRVPCRSIVRSSVSVFSVSKYLGFALGLAALLAVVLLLVACQMPRAQKGGAATTTIHRGGYTNLATLTQSENPKEPSRQTVQSEQTLEYILPAGTIVPTSPGSSTGTVLERPVPVRVVAKDRTDTRIGGAQKDTVREWAGKAANLQPVMWAGIAMMTVVAGVLLYFGWWTKAALAIAVGIGMVVLAQGLPDHGTAIVLGGLSVFSVVALLVLYAYYKGQLDRSQNGIPDFLEKDRETSS